MNLGPYALEQVVARGGMGEVWAARHRTTDERVAIKVLSVVHPTLATLLQREIRVVAGLDHPHVVRVLDTGRVPEDSDTPPAGTPWLAMPWLPGGNAEQRPPGSWPELRAVLGAVLSALAHAHARGVLHRDVKPANVLFDEAGRPLLADFGMTGGLQHGDAKERPARGGTPGFMAPEQAAGSWFLEGPPTDLYAVGVLAWVLACGRVPPLVPGAPLPPLAGRFPLPDGLEPWILRCTEVEPSDRYGLAADVLQALPAEGAATHVTVAPLEEAGATWVPDMDTPIRVSAPRGGAPRPPPRAPDLRPTATHGLGAAPLRVLAVRGRERERALLWEELSRAAEGGVRAVVLGGAAGTGKSRLAQWICEQAAEHGVAWPIRVRFGDRAGALDEALTDLLRLRDVPPDREAARVRSLVPACADRVLALRGGTLPTAHRLEVFREAFAERAGRTAVVWLDDAHADDQAVTFARSWQRAGGPPALLVLTVRDDLLDDQPDVVRGLAELDATTLPLAPLDDASQADLVRQIAPCSDTIVEAVVRRSGGNPHFAAQVVLDWIGRGELRSTSEGLVPRGGEGAVPTDLHEVWRGRVNPLLGEPELRAGLLVAAALGRKVALDEWEAACVELGTTPPARLWEMLVADALATVEVEPPRLVFAHGLLRDALLPLVSREVHAACARALRSDAIADRRAWHEHEAGDLEAALTTLNHRALNWWGHRDFRRARRLVARQASWSEGLPAGDERRIWPRLELARMRYLDGDLGMVEEMVLIREWVARWPATPRLRRVAVQLESMLATLERRDQDIPGLLLQALGHCEHGRERQRVLGDLLVHHLKAGHFRDAVDVGRRALEEQDSHAQTETWVRTNLAAALGELGRVEEAEAQFAETSAALESLGSRLQIAQYHATRGNLALGRGELRCAREHFLAASAEWDAVGVEVPTLGHLEVTEVLLGERDPAELPAPPALHEAGPRMLAALRATARREWDEVTRIAGLGGANAPTRAEERIWRRVADAAADARATEASTAARHRAEQIAEMCHLDR
ncbi:MAG: protein kinase [Myxococcales bacterium]|nr:protein kinase [Myxococcales bacterium]